MSATATRSVNLPHEFVPTLATHGVVDVTDSVLDAQTDALLRREFGL